MSQLLTAIPHVLTWPVIRILLEDIDFSPRWLNILVERQVLDSDCKTAAGHVELLVNGFHLLS